MANNITKQDVLNFASELSSISDAQWIDLLAYVNLYDLAQVADLIEERMARIFLAAHTASMAKKAVSGTAGPVTSESAGNVRRSYGLVASSTESSLSSSRYGQLFLDILGRSLASGPMVV